MLEEEETFLFEIFSDKIYFCERKYFKNKQDILIR